MTKEEAINRLKSGELVLIRLSDPKINIDNFKKVISEILPNDYIVDACDEFIKDSLSETKGIVCDMCSDYYWNEDDIKSYTYKMNLHNFINLCLDIKTNIDDINILEF